SDLSVLLAVGVVAILAGFWLLVLTPKRDEAAKLGDQVTELQSSVTQQQQLAADAEQAKRDFGSNYRRLVVLGKGVPADADTPSLLVQMQRLADKAHVDFHAVALQASDSSAAAQIATPPPLVAPGDSSSSSSDSSAQPTDASSSSSSSTAPTDS